MKSIFAILTMLLLVSVSYATTITLIQPQTFALTAHQTSGPARTMTFTFRSDVNPGSVLDVTHTGTRGSFCMPDGTTFFSDPFGFISCSGFIFTDPDNLSTMIFNGPTGGLSDALTLAPGPTAFGGVFASAPTIVEPAGLAVLGTGLLVLAGVLRRRVRK